MVASAAVGILVALAFLALTSRSRSTRTSASRLRSLIAAHSGTADVDGRQTGGGIAGATGGRVVSGGVVAIPGRIATGIGVVTGTGVGAGSGHLLGAVNGVVAGLGFGCLATVVVLRLGVVRAGRRRVTAAARRAVAGASSPAALPAALDLVAACLSAGAPLEQALSVVAAAFDTTSVGRLLDGIARLTALGAPPELAWADACAEPACDVVARAVIRAHYSGASLSDVLSRAADDRRRTLRSDAEAAAARASVRAVLPLGLCFLPAFVLVGVVPVVAGFAGSMWG
ncbi:MAG: type II secretion system F family protein [Acidothermaceae bacterium]